MTKRTKRLLFAISGIFGIFVIAIVVMLWSVLNSFDDAFHEKYPHRSDAEMIKNFNEHRHDFEFVRTKAMADDILSRVDEDWYAPDNLDSEKVAEYRRLFTVIGTPRGISQRPGSGRIEFFASSLGWVTSGSTKGYLYTEEKPAKDSFVDSLDDYSKLTSESKQYLKPIEGNWYLFFER